MKTNIEKIERAINQIFIEQVDVSGDEPYTDFAELKEEIVAYISSLLKSLENKVLGALPEERDVDQRAVLEGGSLEARSRDMDGGFNMALSEIKSRLLRVFKKGGI